MNLVSVAKILLFLIFELKSKRHFILNAPNIPFCHVKCYAKVGSVAFQRRLATLKATLPESKRMKCRQFVSLIFTNMSILATLHRLVRFEVALQADLASLEVSPSVASIFDLCSDFVFKCR